MQDVPVPSITLSAYADTALNQAASAMRPGWVVLHGCVLGEDGACPASRVQYAVLHAQVGIALLDVVPGTTTTNAVERLGRQLDAAGFQVVFQRNPPMRYFCVPLRAVPDIGRLLDQEFGQHSPSTLPHGDAWVATVQRLLMAEPLRDPPQSPPGSDLDDQPRQRHARVWQHAAEGHRLARLLSSGRCLGGFWGLVGIVVGGGGLLLQYLGPPKERAGLFSAGHLALAPGAEALAVATDPPRKTDGIPRYVPSLAVEAVAIATDATRVSHAAADVQTPADADPQRAIAENELAIAELQRRLKRFGPEANAGLRADTVSAEASPSRALPELAGTLAQPAANLSAPVAPLGAATTNIVSDVTAAPAAQAAHDTLISASAPLQADIEAPNRRGDVSVPTEDSPASTETIPANSATAPDTSADGPQNAPEAAAASPAVVPPVPPRDEKSVILVQGPSPQNFGASASPAEPASMAQPQIFMKTAAPQSPGNAPSSTSTAMVAEIMVRRADALLHLGDISAARLLYERAAAAGSGHAATAMGKTFDAAFLAEVGAVGMGADPTLAATWYRRAIELGDAEARSRLQAPPPTANRTSTASESRL